MELKSLVDQPNKLPTIPKVVQRLIESFNDDDVSSGEISSLIATDPALTAKLLRLANSAYFQSSRTIGTVDEALRKLGFVMVRNMVLGNGMVGAFRNIPGIDLKQFWRYNLHTACASRWLAGVTDVNQDMVFTLGMMHGIGQLQMHVGMPDVMAPLDRQMSVLDAERATLEKDTLGFHYGNVSAELARIWNFPQSLILALRDIPLPLASGEFSAPAACVHLGAWRARVEAQGLNEEQIAACYPKEVGRQLEIAADWLPALTAGRPGPPENLMPPLEELTANLESMIE